MHYNKTELRRPWIVALMWLLTCVELAACDGGGSSSNPPPVPNRGSVVSTSDPRILSVVDITNLLTNINNRVSVAFTALAPIYDVDAYVLTYATIDPSGNTTNASGLLLVPVKPANSTSPLMSLQHGTEIIELQAPSHAWTSPAVSIDAQAGFIIASSGYIVAMPDYLGYGASKQIFHPYVQASSLASATIDMIRASRNALRTLNVPTNGQLFLAGYSEGGYATLATQQELETSLSQEIPITASEPGSGPYDMIYTTAHVLAATDINGITNPNVIGFLFKAYDLYYNSPSRLSEVFTPAALTCQKVDFNGTFYGADPVNGDFSGCINAIDGDPYVLANTLNASFLDAFNNGGETAFKASIAKNDIYDWMPLVPTRLFYSPEDDVVPPQNTPLTYQAMVMQGANAALVQSTTCTGVSPASHTNCATPYFNDAMSYFATMATGL